jgi:hypothetical protein
MSDQPSEAEMRAFAARHGLERLAPEHIRRMAELAPYVSDLGRSLPRVPDKAGLPAPIPPPRTGWLPR